MKIPWTKQPQYPAGVNSQSLISRGLVFAAMPGISNANLVSGKIAFYTGQGLTGYSVNIPTKIGIARKFNNNYIQRVGSVSPISSGDMTLLVVTVPSTPLSGVLFGVFNTTSSNAVSNYISIESGPVFAAVSTDSSNWSIASGPAPVSDSSVILCATFKASGQRTLYVDGVQKAQNTTPINPTGLNEILIGCYHGGTGSGYISAYTGLISLCLVFNRILHQNEIKQLSENPWQIFAPLDRHIHFPVGSAPQLLVPISDVSAGSWTPSSGSDLFAMLDEASYSDADYIVTSTPSTCEMRVTTATDPAVSTGHILRYRLLSGTGAVTAILKQGSTTIASFGPHTLTGAAQDFAQTLSAGEADSITDYSDLRVVFTAS